MENKPAEHTINIPNKIESSVLSRNADSKIKQFIDFKKLKIAKSNIIIGKEK